MVILACGRSLDGGLTEVVVSSSCPGRSRSVCEELEVAERPAGSHLGCVTQPSKASNCLKS